MQQFTVLKIFVAAALAVPTFTTLALDRMDERVAPCAACHGEKGRSQEERYSPSIAGKPAHYLYNQLRHFRDGQRLHTVMSNMLATLSDEYLLSIAEYYAAQTPRLTTKGIALNDELAQRAKRLVSQGDALRDIPACTSCHGKALHGSLPAIPGLTGLDAEYIAAQMGAWRAGVRSAGTPDCMGQVARRMSPEQINLVSAWLAAESVSEQDHPAPESNQKLPLTCFSAALDVPPKNEESGNPPSPQYLHGEYLVRAGNCVGCHASRDGEALSGGNAITTPFGDVYSSNLTPDLATGIGRWSADDFWIAMRQGISADGRLLYPAFPYTHYTLITRADSDAMLSYLKAQKPVSRPATAHELRFPFNTQLALRIWRWLFFDEQTFIADPQQDESWNRGRYLVEGLGHCSACHGDRNALGALRQLRAFAGSLMPDQVWYAPPLQASRDEADRSDLRMLLKHGTSQQRVASGPMAKVVSSSLQYLSEDDLAAMIKYIDSRTPTQATAVASLSIGDDKRQRQMLSGKSLYQEHCATCHGEHGLGESLIYPPLKGNQLVLAATPGNAIRTVKFGGYAASTAQHPYPYGMPSYAHQLSDEDIAAVLTYIRNAWGNQASAVSPVQVGR